MPSSARKSVRRWQAALIITLFALAVIGSAAIGWRYARESPPHQGPIVLVSADGLSAAGLAVYGARETSTPAIDILASESVVFERAYSHSPQPLPAHASMLSGQLPLQHGVRDDAGFTFPESTPTLAQLLRNRGFATGAAVSSFLLQKGAGLEQGFTFFDDEIGPGSAAEIPLLERPGVETVEAAEQWLALQRDQRFFLFVQVAARDADAAILRLSAALKHQGLYDQATIIFVGAHGTPQLALRLDDRTLHVPLLVKQPNGEGSQRRVATPVQHVDLVPTVLDLVRAPWPGDLAGRSLRPLLDDEDGSISEALIYAESLAGYLRFGAHSVYALAGDRFRYILGAGEELVPLDGLDGFPTAEAAEAGRLRAGLEQLLAGSGPAAPTPIRPAEVDRYALFGYLSPGLVAPDSTLLDEGALRSLFSAHHGAAVLVGQKQYTAGIRALQSVVRTHPSLAPLRYQLGSVLVQAGRTEEAIDEFRILREQVPDSTVVARVLAEVLLHAGHVNLAREHATAAVDLAPLDDPTARAAAHTAAALVALAENDREGALRHGEAAFAADPTRPTPQFVEGRLLYEEGRFAEAVEVLGEAAVLTRQHGTTLPELHFLLGESLTRLERYEEAETEFREELRQYPRSMQAYRSLAMLYSAWNRHNAVEDVLNELVASTPTPEGYAVAARLWTALGDPSRAEALRSDARSRFRGDPSLALLAKDPRP